MNDTIRFIVPEGGPAALGEAPTWWAHEGLVIWTDIEGHRLHLYDPATRRDRTLKTTLAVTRVLCRGVDLVAVTPRALYQLNPYSGSLSPIVEVDDLPAGSRFNDAALDAHGRVWVGTVGAQGRSGDGRLYCHDIERGLEQVGCGYDACNGIGFAPDQSTLYLTDTRRRQVLAYDYVLSKGSISGQRTYRSFDQADGYPDGLAVVNSGSLWHAMWDGSCLIETRPSGAPGRILTLPVRRPTSLTFTPAGVFVTTAQGSPFSSPWEGTLLEIDHSVFCVPTDLNNDSR
jgi:sugar lactone lactonase YvrE